MKTLPGPLLLLLLLLLLLTNCDHKDGADDPGPAPDTTTSFPDLLTSGSWVVSAYTERGEDKTSDFNDLRFTFDRNGQATAVKGSSSTPGSWLWSSGGGYYGNPDDSKTVTFDFGPQKPLGRLTGGWLILGAGSAGIRLDSSNPAEQEHLELSR